VTLTAIVFNKLRVSWNLSFLRDDIGTIDFLDFLSQLEQTPWSANQHKALWLLVLPPGRQPEGNDQLSPAVESCVDKEQLLGAVVKEIRAKLTPLGLALSVLSTSHV